LRGRLDRSAAHRWAPLLRGRAARFRALVPQALAARRGAVSRHPGTRAWIWRPPVVVGSTRALSAFRVPARTWPRHFGRGPRNRRSPARAVRGGQRPRPEPTDPVGLCPSRLEPERSIRTAQTWQVAGEQGRGDRGPWDGVGSLG